MVCNLRLLSNQQRSEKGRELLLGTVNVVIRLDLLEHRLLRRNTVIGEEGRLTQIKLKYLDKSCQVDAIVEAVSIGRDLDPGPALAVCVLVDSSPRANGLSP